MDLDYPYYVKLQVDRVMYWNWCCDTLVIGEWKKLIGFMGDSATYCFVNGEDAIAFKLVHSV